MSRRVWLARILTGVCLVLAAGCSLLKPNQAPVALFTVSAEEAAIFVEIVFDASASTDHDGEIMRYLWDFGDGATAEGIVVSHAYRAVGTYTVTLTVEDNGGARATAARTITVVEPTGPGGPLVAAFTVSADVVAPFEDVTFDASSSYCLDAEILEYLWDFGDGGEDEGKVVVYSYFDLGVYIVTLTVRDSLGRTATAKKVIQVVEIPEEEPTVAHFACSRVEPWASEGTFLLHLDAVGVGFSHSLMGT